MNAKESLSALHLLADRAGLMVNWSDAAGQPRQVEPEVLRAILQTLGLPCATIGQCEAARAWLAADDVSHALPPLLTAVRGEPIAVPWNHTVPRHAYRLHLEDGSVITGTAHVGSDGALHVPAVELAGYHRLHLGDLRTIVAVAPHRCFGVADAFGDPAAPHDASDGAPRAASHASSIGHHGQGRADRHSPAHAGSHLGPRAQDMPALPRWGIGVQLYGLRRRDPAPLGDFTTLERLCRAAAAAGAQAVAINPVHANFAAYPERYSPYSPSSRLFLNPLYVDPAALFGAQAVDDALTALGLHERMRALNAAREIDWPAVAALRYPVLHWLWHRRKTLLPPAEMLDYAAFRLRGGDALEAHARYEALQAMHLAQPNANPAKAGDWRQWPTTQRAPQDAAVAAFAHLHADSVDFHAFLQWMAARGLASAQRQARDAGMRIGLIADLAVGTDPGGSQAWSRQDEMLTGVCAGAPPDLMNPLGQNWGVGVFSPRGLRKHGYGGFIEMLRANMAHAGGIRIDHALGLARMWLVPDGASPGTGAYLRYPLEDLLRLIALESWRHRAIVIGENLGTVPADFNAILAERGVLGIDVLWFERASPAAPPDEAARTGDAAALPADKPARTADAMAADAGPAAATEAVTEAVTGAATGKTAGAPPIKPAGRPANRATATPPPAPFVPPEQWPADAVATTTTHDLPTVAGWWAGRDIQVRARLRQLGPGETEAGLLAERARDRGALWQALCDAGVASGPLPPPDDAPLDLIVGWMARARTPLRLLPIEDLLGVREQPNVPGTVEGHPNWQRRLDADVQTLFDTVDARRRIGALTGARHVRPSVACAAASAPGQPRASRSRAACPTMKNPMKENAMPDTADTPRYSNKPASAPEKEVPSRDKETGTHSQEETGEAKPQLPHERDEHHDSQQSGRRPEVEQAGKDIEKGLENTDLYGSRGKRQPN